jgi:hypothetical protein
MSRTSAEEAEADGTASGGWLGIAVSGALEASWLLESPRTAESTMTGSDAAIPWMGATRAATNTITMPALDCFILPIIQVNRYLHKPAPSVNSNRGSNWLGLKPKERHSQELREERVGEFGSESSLGVTPGWIELLLTESDCAALPSVGPSNSAVDSEPIRCTQPGSSGGPDRPYHDCRQ